MVERGWCCFRFPQLSFLNVGVQYYCGPPLIRQLTSVVVCLALLDGTGPPRVQWQLQLLVLFSGAF